MTSKSKNKNESATPRKMPNPDQRLKTSDVAYYLQVEPKKVREWLGTGRLRGTRLEKEWRITWAALDDFDASWHR